MTVDWVGACRDWRGSHASTEATLVRHLDTPRRILDAAGGTGREAVRLALRGHEVTVLDPAGAMLTTAMDHADAAGVADRVHVVQAMAEDAPDLFGTHDFDVVLCHNLLQYAQDRVAMLRALVAPLRPGGLLSVLSPTPASGDPFACAADEVVADLAAVGANVLARYDLPRESDQPAALVHLIARH
ncbi:class I SAM-dependent methyltransferase [Actinokineospora sp.]|uniref:class I SAM-dependent methyltransferase n=1 Tax=Actinokineospora sp. TaxID=1872133 RepID=UPI004037A0B7